MNKYCLRRTQTDFELVPAANRKSDEPAQHEVHLVLSRFTSCVQQNGSERPSVAPSPLVQSMEDDDSEELAECYARLESFACYEACMGSSDPLPDLAMQLQHQPVVDEDIEEVAQLMCYICLLEERNENTSGATQLYEAVLRLDPGCVEAWHGLGQLLLDDDGAIATEGLSVSISCCCRCCCSSATVSAIIGLE